MKFDNPYEALKPKDGLPNVWSLISVAAVIFAFAVATTCIALWFLNQEIQLIATKTTRHIQSINGIPTSNYWISGFLLGIAAVSLVFFFVLVVFLLRLNMSVHRIRDRLSQ